MTDALTRRSIVDGGLAAAALALLGSAETDAATPPTVPWIKRFFHLYTGPDGLTRAELVPFEGPTGKETQQLLRRNAERVTLGAMAPNFAYDFHVANQPTLLIPLFGSVVVKLADGTVYEAGHGDVVYAEDCSGKGHISGGGKEGAFVVQIQLPKPLCPMPGSTDMTKFWREPA